MTLNHCLRFLSCIFILGCFVSVDANAGPGPVTCRINLLGMTQPLSLGQSASLRAQFAVSQRPEVRSKIFLNFFMENRLQFVAEEDPGNPTDSWLPEEPTKASVKFQVPKDIPAGIYKMEIGVYGMISDGTHAYNVEIKGPPEPPRKPLSHGSFLDREGWPHRWRVTESNALIWDGAPYLPIGGMFIPRSAKREPIQDPTNEYEWTSDAAMIDLVHRYGVKDLYLHFGTGPSCNPARMQRIIDYLESKTMRYGLEFAEDPGQGPCFQISADGPKILDVTSSGFYQVEGNWPGGLYLAVDADGKAVAAGEAKRTTKGLGAEVVCPAGGKINLYFTPRGKTGNYFWNGVYENYENRVRTYLSSLRFGTGFRFLLDPFSNEMMVGYDYMPDSDEYRAAFAAWLAKRYETIENLDAKWGSTDVKTFEQASSLIPLRISPLPSEKGFLYDLKSGLTITADLTVSEAWDDMKEYRAVSTRDACNRISRAIKQCVDVPVVFKHCPQVDRYRVNDSLENNGFDGIGLESYGSGDLLPMFCGGGAYAEAAQANRTMWVITTETSQGAWLHQNPTVAYQDRLSMYSDFCKLMESGSKGIFTFGLCFGGPGGWRATEQVRDPQQLEWMSTFKNIVDLNSERITNFEPKYYYWYPERRKQRETFGRLEPGYIGLNGIWNGYFEHYGIQGLLRAEDGVWILPTWSPDVKTDLLFSNLEDSPASTRWGEGLERAIRGGRTPVLYMGYRKDIGTIPHLDVYFTDQFDVAEDGSPFQALRPIGDCEILGQTPSGSIWALQSKNIQIVSKQVPDLEGWMPKDLRRPKEEDRPLDYAADVLGLRVLDLGEDLQGFSYEKKGWEISYIWPRGQQAAFKMKLPRIGAFRVQYTDGVDITESIEKRAFEALLIKPQWKLTSQTQYGLEGPHVDSFQVRHVLVFEGIDPDALVKAAKDAATVPKNIVFLEGEDADSNFNFGRVAGLPSLNKRAFQLLETFQPPQKDTGYFAKYSVDIDNPGAHSLWVRERYLLFQSPCNWRIDDGEWQSVSSHIIPAKAETSIVWTPFDDDQEVFAWYKYGEIPLTKGKHTLEIRVDQPRECGDKYCKGIDLISLAFEPEETVKKMPQAALNIAPNPSFEFGEGATPLGWSFPPKTGKAGWVEWRKNQWGPERISHLGHHAVVLYGPQVKDASSANVRTEPLAIKAGQSYQLNVSCRAEDDDQRGYVGLRFYNASGKQIDSGSRQTPKCNERFETATLTGRAPDGAEFLVIQLGYQGDRQITFDDVELFEIHW